MKCNDCKCNEATFGYCPICYSYHALAKDINPREMELESHIKNIELRMDMLMTFLQSLITKREIKDFKKRIKSYDIEVF